MKEFFYGLTAGIAAGIAAQMMIAKNHEQMLELVRSLRPVKLNLDSDIENLYMQKEQIDNAIKEKESSDTITEDLDRS